MDEIMELGPTKIDKTIQGKRAQCGVLDDYRGHDAREIARIILPLLYDKNGNPYATQENIEDVLDKIFNNDESQE